MNCGSVNPLPSNDSGGNGSFKENALFKALRTREDLRRSAIGTRSGELEADTGLLSAVSKGAFGRAERCSCGIFHRKQRTPLNTESKYRAKIVSSPNSSSGYC